MPFGENISELLRCEDIQNLDVTKSHVLTDEVKTISMCLVR